MTEMNNSASQPAPGGLNPREILMILFRNKWKIILFALLGVGAAAGVYVKQEPPYESTAEVLVRYVVESQGYSPTEEGYSIKSADVRGGVLTVEQEILTSWDLAKEVAEKLGPGLILGRSDLTNALLVAQVQIKGGMSVEFSGNVIGITYRNQLPDATVIVLREIITNYFTAHFEAHRPVGSSDNLQRDTELKKSKMEQAQRDLAELNNSLGIATTLEDEKLRVAGHISDLESQIIDAESELVHLEAQLSEAQKKSIAQVDETQPVSVVPKVDESILQKYRTSQQQLAMFKQVELNLIGQFTPENPQMKEAQRNISELESQLRSLEKEHPGILAAAGRGAGERNARQMVQDNSNLTANVFSYRARLKILNDRLEMYTGRLGKMIASENTIRNLQRDLKLLDEQYQHFASKLEREQFDERLDPSSAPNISVIQSPSMPVQDNKKRLKTAGGAFAVFFALGVGLAFARELIFDQSIRSPLDIESKLQLPLFMSIPMLSDRQPVKLLANGPHDEKRVEGELAPAVRMPWELSHFIRPYCEALRDRLIMYFQLKNLHHKPKLVAVTSCNEGAGSTTLSAGLAASLSETGDGKVLLVDMNIRRPEMHPFFRGNLASSLSDLLQPNIESGHGEKENLYLATATERNGTVTPLVPAKFYELLPKLKSSNFDYIIFDMPPIKQTSATVALSGLMDKVLLVVEPGKTNRDAIKRATDMMREQHADVAGVVNRMPKSAAKWLQPDLA